MNSKKKVLSLLDMDVGLFVSYELTTEWLTTKLFRIITLNSIPLRKVMDFREAEEEDVTNLNRLNWFRFPTRRKNLCPVYTLRAGENSPRIFMRLAYGSHIDLKHTLGERNAG